MQKEILNINDIKQLVDAFYAKVQQDELLADIFNNVIQDNWPKHLEKMYSFWQTVLLEEHTYYGAPFMPHMNLPVSKKHFDRWLELFYETLDELFEGEKAEEARWRANKMAEMFQLKIAHYQKTNSKPLI
ncbi:hemoglobin [Gillisia sp. Hel_I_86]|uniref:group III truncated hemoglobin n=1 Tax=Gillisia sp. Hel_I_86 TaxID=1249981 RepID=UPI00119C1186|nr:group III truncated hemoglobin [Gillisia sp. Hel_I_86]TVZ28624.1 hemoglobin [Gillisia sp. Hel_I_86]